jgi:hypothetical protein
MFDEGVNRKNDSVEPAPCIFIILQPARAIAWTDILANV